MLMLQAEPEGKGTGATVSRGILPGDVGEGRLRGAP